MNERIIKINGHKYWYNEAGQYHREDGPAAEYTNGTKKWYIKGDLHRKDGPAVELVDGDKYWYQYGKLHRTDGPAIIFANGKKEYYLNHRKYDSLEAGLMDNALE